MRLGGHGILVSVCLLLVGGFLTPANAQQPEKPRLPTLGQAGVEPFDRITSGDLKGFISLPQEQFIIDMDDLFVVRDVHGRIFDGPFEESRFIQYVIIELRGPDPALTIYRADSDRDGRFRFDHLPEGMYTFKTSFFAYQSIVGRIKVSRTAGSPPIALELLVDN